MASIPWYWMVAALFAVVALTAGVTAVLWAQFWRERLQIVVKFDEQFETQTSDGATLFLGHIKPRGPSSDLPPVVLCHGLAMNHVAFAYDPQHGLAGVLSDRGRDCWVIELRGAGSGPKGPPVRHATFDTYATHDLPTVIDFVRAMTEASTVDWVGFSMGGMLIYAHLGAHKGEGVRRVVTIGSPVRFRDRYARHVAEAVPYVLTPFGMRIDTPFRFVSALIAPLLGRWVPRLLTRGYRDENYAMPMLRRIIASSFSDVPAGVLRQFARWVAEDSLNSNDATYDYRHSLADIRTPMLVIAGDRDRLARPHGVHEAYECIGSSEKRYLEIGKESGAQTHYDHLDLIAGKRSHEEVFGEIVAWLEKN
jgi:pimeloyl-ACP methyl ester carboxylesterase